MSKIELSQYQQTHKLKQLELNKQAAQKILEQLKFSLAKTRVSSIQVRPAQ
jgi:hypothetical protein